MAKRKNAAALFEVFNDNRGASNRARPRWSRWFAGRAAPGATAVDPNDPTTMPIKSPLIAPVAPRIAAVEAMPVAVATAPSHDPTVASPVAQQSVTASAAPHGSGRFHLDPDTREVTMRLPFTHVVVTAFAILLTFAMCYVVGRRTGAASVQMAKAAPVEQNDDPLSQPVQPKALDVRRSTPAATPTPTPRPSAALTQQQSTSAVLARDHESAPMANSVRGLATIPKPPPADGPRIIGLNYWLVQTYPTQEGAVEARDFLLKNGVSCTVEKAPPGFAIEPTWYAVISTKGFEHIHTPECDAVKHQIEKVGDKFAGSGKFKRFAPQLFKLK